MEKAEVPVPNLHRLPSISSPGLQGPPLEKTQSATEAALARVTSHLTSRSIINPGPPPDGGLQAWTQVFCAWLAIMNTWGFVNSFGAFQTYYASILPQSNSTISWIGSTQAALLFFLGTFSGRALDAGLFRPTVLIGITLQLIGMFTMSFAKNYWQLLLTQGICTGVGGGIFFVPVMGLTSTYFAKKRGMALGIVTSGNSFGGIVYPIVVRQLLDKVGFGWTVRVLGFINVVSLAVVIAFMKPRLPPRKAGPLIDMDAFRDHPYMLHVLGICFLMPAVYFVFYYIASFARDELGMSYTDSLNLVIIVNGIGIPARVLPGFIADRYFGVLNTIIFCLFLNIIILWAWLGIHDIPGFYAFTAIYGLASASFQSLFPTTIAVLSNDITKTGTRLGMAFSAIAGSALVGGPIAGALLKAGGNYTAPICWASAGAVVGTVMVICARGVKYGWTVKTRC
ncbi:major facilitator superfamily domain-containing protein [Lophiotrema nucula]|uniref:Major facilitator superfamily domain-containing protein n=1 Tax=Lophiotrema nucula TaxID=690887 RepID=A0A6A5Z0Y4_9PLEO|nr:major facilitator superfamily domain-containing protein [Lophiotrema nucula]